VRATLITAMLDKQAAEARAPSSAKKPAIDRELLEDILTRLAIVANRPAGPDTSANREPTVLPWPFPLAGYRTGTDADHSGRAVAI
jgi:hypothetical protein